MEGRRKPTATTPPNQPVVVPDYHNNAAHAAMTKIIIYKKVHKKIGSNDHCQ